MERTIFLYNLSFGQGLFNKRKIMNFRIALILSLSLFSIKASSQDLWYSTHKDSLGFRIFFPEKPTEAEQIIESGIGSVNQQTYYLNNDNGPVYFYQLNYIEYPEGTIHSDSIDLMDDFYLETVHGAVEKFKGTLAYDTEIELNGVKGRMYRIDYMNNTLSLKTKVYVIRNRYYSIQAIYKKGQKINALDRFFDSFDLIPVRL